MAEFEIPKDKLEAMRQEHGENTWLSWVQRETHEETWRIWMEGWTPERDEQFQRAIEAHGGPEGFATYIKTTPEYQAMREKQKAGRPQFIAELMGLQILDEERRMSSPLGAPIEEPDHETQMTEVNRRIAEFGGPKQAIEGFEQTPTWQAIQQRNQQGQNRPG